MTMGIYIYIGNHHMGLSWIDNQTMYLFPILFEGKNLITVALNCTAGVDIGEASQQAVQVLHLEVQLPNEPRSGYAHCP